MTEFYSPVQHLRQTMTHNMTLNSRLHLGHLKEGCIYKSVDSSSVNKSDGNSC